MPRSRIDGYLGPQKEIIEPSELVRYENSGKWVADEKVDGGFSVLSSDTHGRITGLYSRTGLPFDNDLIGHEIGLSDSILVGEYETATQHARKLFEKNGFRRLWLFDVVRLFGQDVCDEPLEVRRSLLRKAAEIIHTYESLSRTICLVRQEENNFTSFYKEIKENGGEGLVLKRKGSKYQAQTSDGRTTNWVRCKDILTTDLYVCGVGLTPSRVVNLRVGTWDGDKIIELQSLAVPKGYTAEQLLGTVIECAYDCRLEKGTYRHLRFIRTRVDKTKEMC